ncbi:MAG: glycine zipper 2TM domain-containing protein [Pseudomonadota bacterium]
MEANQMSHRIHPLMATAAVSLTLVSLVGIAAITGILPSSRGSVNQNEMQAAAAAATPVNAPAQYSNPAPAPAPVVHHRQVSRPAYHASQASDDRYNQQVAYKQPEPAQPASNYQKPTSGIGIATGAVIGGLLGNQVGGGNGRTLATIAGAVGGGYFGNEVEKKTR